MEKLWMEKKAFGAVNSLKIWKFVFRQKLLKKNLFLPNVWQNINLYLACVIPLGVPGPPDLVPDALLLLLLQELSERSARGDWDAEPGAAWAAEFHLAVTHHSLLVLVMTVNGNQ